LSQEASSDVAAWARAHQAAYEFAPLVESHQGKKLQVGFTLTLYALMPMDKPAGAERQAAALQVWEGLRDIAQALAPKEGAPARLEIEPARFAAVLRPENELKAEIALYARLFHTADTFAEVTEEEKEKVAAAPKRLTQMGLRQGHW
jgi:hypothetical protein